MSFFKYLLAAALLVPFLQGPTYCDEVRATTPEISSHTIKSGSTTDLSSFDSD
jgi:hypothetical protein